MNGWIKHYADGGKYIGSDEEVYSGRASWRKSPSQGLVAVDLVVNGEVKSLIGIGEYWQSDMFESTFPGDSRLIKRRIQHRLESGKWFTLEYDHRHNQWSQYLAEGRL